MILKNRLSQGIIWNYISLIFLSVAGLLINIIIARNYGSGVLGFFNQVYAVYVVFSQIAVGGLHFSTLRHVAKYPDDLQICYNIVSASVILTAINSIITITVLFFLSSFVAAFFQSPDVETGIRYALPGLFFFALNKTIINAFNGFNMMKRYALINTIRYVLLILFLIILWQLQCPYEMLPAIFSLSEACLFVIVALLLIGTFSEARKRLSIEWFGKHIVFGIKSLSSGLLFDVNPRIDIILLGHFATNRIVGLYSLAAFFAEGFYQLPIVIQRNINPIISRCLISDSIGELSGLVRKCNLKIVPAMFVIGLLSAVVYPHVIIFFTGSNEFYSSWPIYLILITGIIIASGYIPFNMLLNQAGFPGHFSVFLLLIVLSNVLLNLLLIPIYGMTGAAVATAIAQVLSIVYLKLYARKLLGIRI